MYEDSTMVNSHDVLETALDIDPLNNGLPLIFIYEIAGY
jgi:hypothetical protein